jgi:hypothetical protein
MELLFVQFLQVPCYLVLVRLRYLLHHPDVENPQLRSSFSVRDQMSHPHKTTGKIIFILMASA